MRGSIPVRSGALLRLPAHRARGGGGARAGARDPVDVRQPAVAARRPSRRRACPMPTGGAPRSPARSPRDPKLLLLDEPTAGMNPAETLELADQIKSLNRLGLTILLIEHKLDVVAMLADKVVVLDHGEKIAEGHARRGAPRRGGDPRLSRPQRASADAPLARISRRRHPLRRPARPEIGRLPDRGGRDRLPVGRQRLRQVDDDEGDHGERAADPRRDPLRGQIAARASAPPSGCGAALPRCSRRGGCFRA